MVSRVAAADFQGVVEPVSRGVQEDVHAGGGRSSSPAWMRGLHSALGLPDPHQKSDPVPKTYYERVFSGAMPWVSMGVFIGQWLGVSLGVLACGVVLALVVLLLVAYGLECRAWSAYCATVRQRRQQFDLVAFEPGDKRYLAHFVEQLRMQEGQSEQELLYGHCIEDYMLCWPRQLDEHFAGHEAVVSPYSREGRCGEEKEDYAGQHYAGISVRYRVEERTLSVVVCDASFLPESPGRAGERTLNHGLRNLARVLRERYPGVGVAVKGFALDMQKTQADCLMYSLYFVAQMRCNREAIERVHGTDYAHFGEEDYAVVGNKFVLPPCMFEHANHIDWHLPAAADWEAPWPRDEFVQLQQRILHNYAFRDINAYEQKLYNPSLEQFRLSLLG